MESLKKYFSHHFDIFNHIKKDTKRMFSRPALYEEPREITSVVVWRQINKPDLTWSTLEKSFLSIVD